MYFFLRAGAFVLRLLGYLHLPIEILRAGFKRKSLPPITNNILKISAIDLAERIRTQQVKSEEVVRAYIDRINCVNQYLNAVIEDRFECAIEDAKRADFICSTESSADIAVKYPLLGVPFTVKESCGLKGLSFAVGNIPRKGTKASEDGEVIANLRAAGAIPLLVSANPEFCLSWECNSLLTGRCNNAYDFRRTSGGSSGGEAALNGAGATPFGIGSDLAGSIRIPSLFNGLFGHKPTGELLSLKGHFASASVPNFDQLLQPGPITRFARDLPTLLDIMAGQNISKLNLSPNVKMKDIKIQYLEDAGFTLMHSSVTFDTKLAILRAVEHFKRNGLYTKKANIGNMQETFEISLAPFCDMEIPSIFGETKNSTTSTIIWEFMKSSFGKSKYSFAALYFLMIGETKILFPKSKRKYFIKKGEELREQLIEMLGTNGVLFYPTYNEHSLRHNRSYTNFPGVMFAMLVNVLGFPATQVPMGLDGNGRPVGFQVIAAPYQDKLCLTIAAEIEAAFGGWIPPS